jgi:hypothetical protein
MKSPVRGLLIFGFFLAAAALWLSPLIPQPDGIPFQPGAQHSDLLVSHLPNLLLLKRSLVDWGQVPLWNPMILSGAPFAGDPLSGLFYPPNWLLLILPLGLGFNLLLWLHLAFAGMGTFRLLRDEGVGTMAAALAGLAFGGLPKLVGHVGLGHFSLVCAVSWTPWILLAVRNAFRVEVEVRSGFQKAALAGALLGIVFLVDPRWALPAGVLAVAYTVRILAHSHQKHGFRWGNVGKSAGWTVLFGAGVSAALAMPLIQFTRMSTRAVLSAGEQVVMSMPIGHLFGIVLPHVGGYAEWLAYAGVTVLILAIAAIVARQSGSGFWLGIALVSLVMALGENTPLYKWISALPGFDLLRVPPRWLFAFGFALAMLAGRGLDALLEEGRSEQWNRRLRLTFAASSAFFLLLCAGVIWIGLRNPGVPWQSWALFAGLGVASAIWGLVGLWKRLRSRMLVAGWVLLVVIDLAAMNASLLEIKSLESFLETPRWVASSLQADGESSRLFSPSYSLQQQIAAHEGLELADGVNPLQLSAYSHYLAAATGFSTEFYSVTLPPFPSGDPSDDWNPQIDTHKLGLLNVSWVASEFALDSDELLLDRVVNGTYLYINPYARPRAWVEHEPLKADPAWTQAAILERTPNRISISAEGPGRLVLSEIAYTGWQAELDGEAVEITPAYEILRSVELANGEHEVIFRFRPWTVYLGAALSLLTIMVLAALWVRQ